MNSGSSGLQTELIAGMNLMQKNCEESTAALIRESKTGNVALAVAVTYLLEESYSYWGLKGG